MKIKLPIAVLVFQLRGFGYDYLITQKKSLISFRVHLQLREESQGPSISPQGKRRACEKSSGPH